ncbi:MAG TPA: hypothetical protein VK681_39260 [Reyranella sp.]|nr:hypothetical protein [Reyranella sp.]
MIGLKVGDLQTWTGDQLLELGLIPSGQKPAAGLVRIVEVTPTTITVRAEPVPKKAWWRK